MATLAYTKTPDFKIFPVQTQALAYRLDGIVQLNFEQAV